MRNEHKLSARARSNGSLSVTERGDSRRTLRVTCYRVTVTYCLIVPVVRRCVSCTQVTLDTLDLSSANSMRFRVLIDTVRSLTGQVRTEDRSHAMIVDVFNSVR